ncbi:hypothetical protein D932_00267 [Enterococcus casseliflavus 14-MB-W-14]|nr:hypothetical protein D932_00267 [Enterococcus casseliflavus 14-MB-W-14]
MERCTLAQKEGLKEILKTLIPRFSFFSYKKKQAARRGTKRKFFGPRRLLG